jgi:acyl-CoA reductase-like NAD-dependent aldehyde dehydrogenase
MVYPGMSGIVGYSLKGVDVEVTKAFKADSAKSIKSSRIAQGEKEYLDTSEEERRHVLDRWHELLAEEQLRKAQSKSKGKGKARAEDN